MENLQANLTLIQQRLAAASDGKYLSLIHI